MNQTFNQIETVEEYLSSKRWSGIKRDYSANDVYSLRPSCKVIIFLPLACRSNWASIPLGVCFVIGREPLIWVFAVVKLEGSLVFPVVVCMV